MAAVLAEIADHPEARQQVSATELTRAYGERIEELNPRLNAFITVLIDAALGKGKTERNSGRTRTLEGVILAVKDNIAVAGAPMTGGSRLFSGTYSTRDASAVDRLVKAGALVIGKTHLHELAMGATSDNPFFGRCRNPWNPRLSPGGSSGGSAVAVAADLCVAALGTDTGGSIRNPAAICGVTGLRPTAGAVSSTGVLPVAPDFDTVGPMARSASLLGEVFDVMASARRSATPAKPLRDLTVGIAHCPRYDDELSPAVTRAIADAAAAFSEAGVRVVDVDPGDVQMAESVFFSLLKSESARSYASELDRRPEAFSEPLRNLLIASRNVGGGEVGQWLPTAARWRRHVMRDVLDRCDVLLTPLQLEPPSAFDDPALTAKMGRAMRFTFPWSLARLPAISFPCGAFANGLPIGAQLVGRPYADKDLIGLVNQFQGATVWHLRRPELAVS